MRFWACKKFRLADIWTQSRIFFQLQTYLKSSVSKFSMNIGKLTKKNWYFIINIKAHFFEEKISQASYLYGTFSCTSRKAHYSYCIMEQRKQVHPVQQCKIYTLSVNDLAIGDRWLHVDCTTKIMGVSLIANNDHFKIFCQRLFSKWSAYFAWAHRQQSLAFTEIKFLLFFHSSVLFGHFFCYWLWKIWLTALDSQIFVQFLNAV